MDQHSRKQLTSSPEVAMANEVFDQFCNATTLKSILGHFRHLSELLNVRSNTITQFYPKLKAKLRSWKAQALWKKFDQRANHKCYNRGKACPNTRVLIIGGGPCGLRSAIEAQLLGAKVVVVEKRDRMSRNNVLHLWPFVIQDLRGLGAKKFFGKFCAGSIDHISIRQLQCILLKVALILGVEFHENVSFDSLIPPPDEQGEGKIGWRAKTTPADHPVSQYEFDVLIGADGKRNTLDGFKRKEFRGKLAIAITANFINKRTEAEARVEEISGVAFIFNQKFFKELYSETGIDLENIVYYKDDTHYFVMTAKKHSLIDKGVILQDHPDTAKLLAKENVDREALMLYAREAAEFSTEYQMMDMEFAVNHYGQPDVAMFDFTSMYAAENASRILERHGHRLFMILVGDSLLEPFWPTGSGCARGFLSSLDACWAIKGWGGSLMTPLEVIAERESIYRLLGQTTPENLNRDYAAYTLDPHTRYPNLNVRSVTPIQVRSLLDTDDPESIKQPIRTDVDIPKKRRRRDFRPESQVHPDTLLRWLQRQVALYDTVHIEDMGASFRDGMAICAIIHRYRPDLLDFHRLQANEVAKNNQLAFDILEKELGISPAMTGEEMAQNDIPDKLTMFSYLTQIYEAFRGEIPHIKHPKLEPDNEEKPNYSKQISQLTPEQKAQLIGRIAKESVTRMRRSRHSNDNLQNADKKNDTLNRRSRKRRSTEKMGATVEERQRRLEEIEKNRVERMRKRQYLRKMATQQFYKSMQMLQANAKREKDEPFEDYSLFVYRQTAPDFKDRVKYLEQKILYPDREPKMHAGHLRSNIDEEFSGRIKSIEDKLRGSATTEKKPKDLLRAIGKIEKTDWNVKEIEKKIEENKMGRGVRHDKIERVPKWSREQFLARQIKMEKKGRDGKEIDGKYADIDHTLKAVDRKIREGNILGHNKVSAMAEQFSNKNQDHEPKIQRSNSRAALVLPAQGGSEMCHFCNKRVYLMERLSAEGKFFHRGCFRCEYCSTSLRIGNHTFDREKEGGRFYCTQHFGLTGTMKGRAEKKRIPVLPKDTLHNLKPSEKDKVSLDLLDRGQTPERIEFENLARMSDAEDAHSQMDEDEWTDRNFGASAAEMGSSDDISDLSDSDEDNEVYEETMDQPLTTEGTLELAKNWTLRYSHANVAAGQSDTGSNEYEDSSDEYTSEDDESGTATEDEEDVRARELRKLEVWLKVPPRSSDTDTGSETEVKAHQVSNDIAISETVAQSEISSVDMTSSENVKECENRLEESSENTSVTKDMSVNKNANESIIQQIDSSEYVNSVDHGIDDNADTVNLSKDSFMRIILPDAIPHNSDSEFNDLRSDSCVVNIKSEENLPDLIASSSKDSKRSSLSSSSDTFQSISESPVKYNSIALENIKFPVITVTPSSPTSEKLLDTLTLEPTKLTVPKETSVRTVSEKPANSSFDKLIKDLKQRKAKNKMIISELKPLSSPEQAQLNINKYFQVNKKSEAPSTRFHLIQKNNAEKATLKNLYNNDQESASLSEKVIELNIEPKVSTKVKPTDMLKYFQTSSVEVEDSSNLSNDFTEVDERAIENTEINDIYKLVKNQVLENNVLNNEHLFQETNDTINSQEQHTFTNDVADIKLSFDKTSSSEKLNCKLVLSDEQNESIIDGVADEVKPLESKMLGDNDNFSNLKNVDNSLSNLIDIAKVVVIEKEIDPVSTVQNTNVDLNVGVPQQPPQKPVRKHIPTEKSLTPKAPLRRRVEINSSFKSLSNISDDINNVDSLKCNDKAGSSSVSSPNSPALKKKHNLTNKFLPNKSKLYDSAKSLTSSKVDKAKEKCMIS